jgi:type IV pilus assembly protein PilC
MPTFQYTAMDSDGKQQRGKLDANSRDDAAAKLKDRGLFPTRVEEAAAAKRGGGPRAGRKSGKTSGKGGAIVLGTPIIKKKKLPTFTRQLATLLQSGLPLVRGLRTLERQSRKDVAAMRVIGDLADSVEGGSTFSEALAGHPKTFSKLFINMVRAGEAAGEIEGTLDRLAAFMEKSQRIAGRVKSALAYPVVVLVIAGLITAGLMYFVVPKFAEIFEEMLEGEPLPGLTQFVIGASTILKDRGLLVLGCIVGFFVLLKMLRKTKQGSYALDWMKLKTPPINQLATRSAVARLCRTLGTLMNSGVSVLQALQIVKETSGNEVIAQATQKVHDSVKEGESMAGPMESTNVFPIIVVSMVEVGEETGSLPDMLNRIADVYEEEVDRAVDAMTSLLEPIMIVFLAVVVGTIVLAMFMPLIKLIDKLGGA